MFPPPLMAAIMYIMRAIKRAMDVNRIRTTNLVITKNGVDSDKKCGIIENFPDDVLAEVVQQQASDYVHGHHPVHFANGYGSKLLHLVQVSSTFRTGKKKTTYKMIFLA